MLIKNHWNKLESETQVKSLEFYFLNHFYSINYFTIFVLI